MADSTTQAFVDNMIAFIWTAEDPESVTGEIVARIFDFLNKGYKTNNSGLQTTQIELADLKQLVNALNQAIHDVIQTVKATKEIADKNKLSIDTLVGENASEAIDNFREIIAFLSGIKDDKTLLSLLTQLRQDLNAALDDTKNELTEYADDIEVLLTADIRDAESRAVDTAQENVGIYPFAGVVGVVGETPTDDDKIYFVASRKAFYRNRSLLGSPYNKVDGSTVYPAPNIIFRCGSRLFRGTAAGLVALQDALFNSEEITIDSDQRLHLTTDTQRALFNAAFDQAAAGYGKFDPANAPDEQHPYSLNDLWLTYEEAFEVMSWPRLGYANGTGLYMNAQIRTTLPSFHSFGMILPNCSLLFSNAGKIERIALPIAVGRRCFQRCHNLQYAKVYRLFDDNPGTDVFAECYSLQTVDFVDMPSRVSFDIHWSPLLDFATVERFATKAPATGAAMTIIFHADVYAKLTGDTTNEAAAALTEEELTEWMAVADTFATKNIAIATV